MIKWYSKGNIAVDGSSPKNMILSLLLSSKYLKFSISLSFSIIFCNEHNSGLPCELTLIIPHARFLKASTFKSAYLHVRNLCEGNPFCTLAVTQSSQHILALCRNRVHKGSINLGHQSIASVTNLWWNRLFVSFDNFPLHIWFTSNHNWELKLS